VPASGSEAVAWYLKAAQAGNAFAMARVGEMYMQGEHIPRDYPQAYMWLQKGAEAGSFTAMEHLGYAYEYGIGVPRNFTEAMTWYQKEHQASYIPAAASAATRIGYLYQYGRGVPQDYQQAAKWYREAADRGNASGMSHLGVLYQTGQGVPKSLPLAATYYQKAVQLHYDAAALYLGILYQNGWGVPKNLGSARVLFIQASRSDKPQIASAAQRLLRILHDLSDSNMGQDSPNYGLLLLVGIAIVAALSISNDTGNNVGAGTPDVSYPSPAESDKSVCWLKGIVSDWSDGFAKGLMQNQISRTGCF
jgi:TPR repeat protein